MTKNRLAKSQPAKAERTINEDFSESWLAGFKAFGLGVAIDGNPMPKDSGRVDWFGGWLEARTRERVPLYAREITNG